MSTPPPADYRPHAAFLVGASAALLLLLGVALQEAVWQLRSHYRSQAVLLPAAAQKFFDMFGRRPDAYLTAVVFWLWWPMVAALVYCHHRHRPPEAFAVAFLYWFACCWAVAAVVIAFAGLLAILPFIAALRADLQGPPAYMWVVSAVSWCLPVAVLVFAVLCRRRYRGGPDDKP